MNTDPIIQRFEEKFGRFYLKAFKSGKFYALHGTKDNQAEIDYEAGKGNEPTGSDDIIEFILSEVSEADKQGFERGYKQGREDLINEACNKIDHLIADAEGPMDDTSRALKIRANVERDFVKSLTSQSNNK